MKAAAAALSFAVLVTTAPALAASTSSCRDEQVHDLDGNLVNAVDLNAPTILLRLRSKGIDAQSVDDWGGCARADVRQRDGTTRFEFFDPDTLERLTPG
jgi:hypothetical protein